MLPAESDDTGIPKRMTPAMSSFLASLCAADAVARADTTRGCSWPICSQVKLLYEKSLTSDGPMFSGAVAHPPSKSAAIIAAAKPILAFMIPSRVVGGHGLYRAYHLTQCRDIPFRVRPITGQSQRRDSARRSRAEHGANRRAVF